MTLFAALGCVVAVVLFLRYDKIMHNIIKDKDKKIEEMYKDNLRLKGHEIS